MSRDHTSLPPDLRDALRRKSPAERRRLEQVWTLLGHAAPGVPEDVPDADAAWRELEDRLDAASDEPPSRRAADRAPRRRRRRRWHLPAAVAGLFAVLLLGAVWYWQQPVAVTAPPGDQLTVTLPDGSVAELNSGTSLRYRRGFERVPFVAASQRRVTLAGEAFFRVERRERPFVVETFNARVEVLGTQFNVKARAETFDRTTSVTLASGQVRVVGQGASATSPESATLSRAGQVARVTGLEDPRLSLSRTERIDRALAWRTDGFAAIEQPLASILAEVERRFNLAITVEADVDLRSAMTVVYQRAVTAEQILHDVCLARGLQYRRTSRGFELFTAPSPSATTESSAT